MIPMYFHYLNPLPPGNTALPSSLYQKDEDPPEHRNTQLDTQKVTPRQPERLRYRKRGQSVMTYPEFSVPVGFLTALSKDRHSHERRVGQRRKDAQVVSIEGDPQERSHGDDYQESCSVLDIRTWNSAGSPYQLRPLCCSFHTNLLEREH
ncbi:hypothetical protein F7725_017147 [Dissostichus mawsoni]|uniref:Uncharacterized protein n=1 Tax=Dissostichus mawsoni TaxID=36200 RepID=A0A7J5Z3T0_DISMA|nr:hypothetical protein F7725_017147 [Dissostichus mawsoni]